MRRGIAIAAALCALACTDTTGGGLVSFRAAAAGPIDAQDGAPLAFTTGLGWDVTLSRAKLHIGALYLNQSVPISGSQETSCVLPGIYVGEVTSSLDVDLLSSKPQLFPSIGRGTTTTAKAAEVWLTGGDVNAANDPTILLDVQGTAEKGGETRPFEGKLTIGGNRLLPAKDTSLPGSNPICKQRIVSPIAVDLTLADGGLLLVRADPRAMLDAVDFAALAPSPGAPGVPPLQIFADVTDGAPNIAIYNAMRARVGVYTFAFQPDAGTAGQPATGPDAGPTTGGVVSGAGVLQDFVPPNDPGPGGVLVTASGELLALAGYGFPPSPGAEVALVDGWEVSFEHAIVTFDRITLGDNPDLMPSDQSQHGASVAEAIGPWAVDLHLGGPLAGKGGTDRAAPIVAFGGGGLDPARRYALGFETVAATHSAHNVNLNPTGIQRYQDMIAKGHTLFFSGTATFRGTSCTSSDPSYDFSLLPKTLRFEFGLATPAHYVNCQNPDNDPAAPFAGEEHQRGVQVKPNTSVIAQLTFHTDHLFWESVAHDAPAHFDMYAARLAGQPDGSTVTLADLAGAPIQPITDAKGQPVPWRSCTPEYALPGTSALSFETGGIPYNPAGDPKTAIRDLADYVGYAVSTLGHLNADGLCAVSRQFPSPP